MLQEDTLSQFGSPFCHWLCFICMVSSDFSKNCCRLKLKSDFPWSVPLLLLTEKGVTIDAKKLRIEIGLMLLSQIWTWQLSELSFPSFAYCLIFVLFTFLSFSTVVYVIPQILTTLIIQYTLCSVSLFVFRYVRKLENYSFQG